MNEIWKEILQTLGAYAILAAAAAWVLKTAIVAGLQRESARLQEIHKIRFSALHEKRVKTLVELHRLIGNLHGNLVVLKIFQLTGKSQAKVRSQIEAVSQSYHDANTALLADQLFLPKGLAERMRETLEKGSEGISESLRQQVADSQDVSKILESFTSIDLEAMQKELDALGDEVRELLGVTTS